MTATLKSQRTASPGDWPRDELESVPRCPVCAESRRTVLHRGLSDRVFFCAPGVWTLHRCLDCGTAYLDPRPNTDSIGRAYARYYTHSAPADGLAVPALRRRRRRLELRNGYLNAKFGYDLQPCDPAGERRLSPRRRIQADRVVRHLPKPAGPGRLLDLGCGNGAFLLQMRAAGWEVEGIEPDPESVASARAAGLNVRQGVLQPDSYPPEYFDALTLSHVIEHLHDPPDTLRLCHRILKPGGRLWVATPNLASLGHARFGADWFALDPPRHLAIFTPASLRLAMRRAGFEPDAKLIPSLDARWLYFASTHVARGNDPIDAPRLPLLARWCIQAIAAAANRRTLREPEVTEELVLLATRAGPIA